MDWLDKIRDIVMGVPMTDALLKEKRITPRINCQIETEIIDENNKVHEGFAVVLEYLGMRCVAPVKFRKGSTLKIVVREFSGVLGAKRPFLHDTVNAEVVWCRKKRRTSDYYLGLRLADTCDIIDDSWVNFVLASFGITESPYMQKRKEIRVTSNIPAKCFYTRRSFTCGIVADIGLGGLRMILNIDPGRGKDVRLEIGPYKNHALITCDARILRSRFVHSKNRFEVGAEFKDIDNRQMKKLGRYVIDILRETRI